MSAVRSGKAVKTRSANRSVWLYPFRPAAAAAYLLLVVVLGARVLFQSPETVEVTFVLHRPEARTVAVAGDFNSWSPQKGVMQRSNGDWVTTIAMKPGSYQYMFVIDGTEWAPDPASTDFVPGSFGDTNSLIEVRQA